MKLTKKTEGPGGALSAVLGKRRLLVDEKEYSTICKNGRVCVGIDIGTTNISATVFELGARHQLEVSSSPNDFNIASDDPCFAEQDAAGIIEAALTLFEGIKSRYSHIEAVGITGQMHGIVYYDGDGKAISQLITWRDKRGDKPLNDGMTCCDRIKTLTGEYVATGYGFVTHYYNMLHGTVSKDAAGFCSIMDLLAMRMTGKKRATVHSTVASSFGLYDVKSGKFKEDKVKALGICADLLPNVTTGFDLIGEYGGIPVSVAIGDNQASFLGAVRYPRDSILVNVGTGSQISVVTDKYESMGDIEIRPFFDGLNLACGSALCGGYAYALLESFFREYSTASGQVDEPQYKTINRLAAEAYENESDGLIVSTQLCGTRRDPLKRGSIINVSESNFTPGGLALGFIRGIVDELYGFYSESDAGVKKYVVASGGAVRKNTVMQRVISDTFGLPLSVCGVAEEAALGAALFSAMAVGAYKSLDDASELIKYDITVNEV